MGATSTSSRPCSDRAALFLGMRLLEWQREDVAHSRAEGETMPDNGTSTNPHNHLHRRAFLKITGVATAATALGVVPAGQLVYAAALTKAQREKMTPDDVIALME